MCVGPQAFDWLSLVLKGRSEQSAMNVTTQTMQELKAEQDRLWQQLLASSPLNEAQRITIHEELGDLSEAIACLNRSSVLTPWTVPFSGPWWDAALTVGVANALPGLLLSRVTTVMGVAGARPWLVYLATARRTYRPFSSK